MTVAERVEVTKTEEGLKVKIDTYSLVALIAKLTKKEYVDIKLGDKQTLTIDTVTGDVLYFDDNTGEETYLENIVFSE